jgi:hypothetical protein
MFDTVTINYSLIIYLKQTINTRNGISFRLICRPLYPRGKSSRYLFHKKLGWSQSRPGRGGEEKILITPAGNWNPVVKRLEREADLSPPSSSEVKNAWSYTSAPPMCVFMAWCLVKHRNNFTFTFRPLSIIDMSACPSIGPLNFRTNWPDFIKFDRQVLPLGEILIS